MVILVHILIAMLTIVVSLAAVLRPLRSVIFASYTLLAGTVASGILLVVIQPQTLTHACVSGLVVTGVSLVMTRIATKKLAVSRA